MRHLGLLGLGGRLKAGVGLGARRMWLERDFTWRLLIPML